MLRRRHHLVVAVATTALMGATAHAAGTVGELATEAADLVAEERTLVRLADAEIAPSDRADLHQLLRSVDDRGAIVLGRLEQLDVDISDAVRTTLGPLPRRSGTAGAASPSLSVYDRAIDDLRRVADLPGSREPTTEGDRPLALLLVGLGALVVVAVALVAAVLRWRPVQGDLATMAWTDGLTGVANRQRLEHDLVAHSTASPLVTVAMVDVDHFKSVNDRFGHQTGDAALRHVAAAIIQCVRLDDTVYRYGGEEFCVLLPGADASQGAAMAAAIRTAVRQIPLPDGTELTVSIGVADTDGRDVLEAVATADRALYAAKRGGRDQVVVATVDERHLVPA